MFPSRALPRHGIFLCRQTGYLLQHGIECDFLVARPWAPWPVTRIPRWRDYGEVNPLKESLVFGVRAVPYIRPPGAWYRPYEARAMARALCTVACEQHAHKAYDAILATPMFPDAVAAVTLKERLSLPLAALGIGSDVLVYPQQTPALQGQLAGMLREVDLPLGVSGALCRHLQTIGPCRCEPLCVYLGRDDTRFVPSKDKRIQRRQLGWGEDEVVAVYVGRLAPPKGTEEIIGAFGPLLRHYPKLRLVCVGDGPSRVDLQSLALHLDRPNAVSLEGEQSPEQVPLFLQGADIFVFPSHSEGMPQAVLEAMNCGLAVVTTNVGGIPEAVIHEKTGLLIEPRNAQQLQHAVERLIKDEAFRVRMAQQGKQHADKVFDTKTNADKLAQALWSLVP